MAPQCWQCSTWGAHEAVHRQDGIVPSRSRLLEEALAQEGAGHCRALQPQGACEWSWDPACPCPWASGSQHTPGRGQPPAQPTPAPGTAEQRRCVTAGKGHGGQGQGPARQRQWQGPRRLAVPEGVVPRDRAAGCHPCAVCAQGCALPRAAGWLRTRVCTQPGVNSDVRAHTQTRGAPQAPSPRDFPTPGWTQRPCSPPAPCPDLCTNPPGGPWGSYKEGAQGWPRLTEPGAAMKASLLFLLACTAVLAVGASKGQGATQEEGVGALGFLRVPQHPQLRAPLAPSSIHCKD
ncbi:PREDICTED: uncharacterized protein LOC107604165 [Ficedula albicollis]|uniref:uncharacterized protein LOC107604165 n=1 Tax=Ficedula albicollis TaxID=59894 RepID=UPI0007AD81A9|nr:PREDICTED: uncharacterized protein LOC107604165 [Ficedula albicollis]